MKNRIAGLMVLALIAVSNNRPAADEPKKPDNERMLRKAEAKLDHKDPWIRVEAVRILGASGEKKQLPLLHKMLWDPSIDVDLEAVKAMETIRDASSLNVLMTAVLTHELTSIRYYALRAAYRIDKDRVKNTLLSWMKSGEPRLAVRAVECYVFLNNICRYKNKDVLKHIATKASAEKNPAMAKRLDGVLYQILGVSHEKDPAKWQKWIKENDDKIQDHEGKIRDVVETGKKAKEKTPTPEEVAEAQRRLETYNDFRMGVFAGDEEKKDKEDEYLPDCHAYFAARKDEGREASLKFFNGDKTSLRAVEDALNWLMRHQGKDGSWGYSDYLNECSGTPDDPTTIKGDHDVAATGLALLAFLGAGHTHTAGKKEVEVADNDEYSLPSGGKFKPTIERGLGWLLSIQGKDGGFRNPKKKDEAKVNMFEQAIATLALSEAYGMTADQRLAGPAQKAVNFISQARNPDGAWRYTPRCGDNDTSVVGWQVFALKSGCAAGLSISRSDVAAASNWLDLMTDFCSGEVGYNQMGEGSKTITAIGVICRNLLGWRNDNPLLQAGAELVLTDNSWKGGDTNFYHVYQTSLAMFQMGGDYWTRWNEQMSPHLLSMQVQEGHEHGSWSPQKDKHSKSRVYTTALGALSLEVYYRYLPFYR